MIRLQGQYLLSDFKAAQKLHQGSMLGAVILGALTIVFWLILFRHALWPMLEYPLVLVVAFFFMNLLQSRQVSNAFGQQKSLAGPFDMEFSDEGFQSTSEHGSSRLPWTDFVKWKENKDVILLYRTDLMFHVLPKRLFPSEVDIDYVREKLRAHAVPVVGRGLNLRLVMVIVLAFLMMLGTNQCNGLSGGE